LQASLLLGGDGVALVVALLDVLHALTGLFQLRADALARVELAQLLAQAINVGIDRLQVAQEAHLSVHRFTPADRNALFW
jgi:hypothetical protein